MFYSPKVRILKKLTCEITPSEHLTTFDNKISNRKLAVPNTKKKPARKKQFEKAIQLTHRFLCKDGFFSFWKAGYPSIPHPSSNPVRPTPCGSGKHALHIIICNGVTYFK